MSGVRCVVYIAQLARMPNTENACLKIDVEVRPVLLARLAPSTSIPVAEKPQPDRRLRHVFAVRSWLSTVSGRFHVRWRLSFDRKPKACAHVCAPNAHAFGLRSNEGTFCGGILFDPKPQVMALAASLR